MNVSPPRPSTTSTTRSSLHDGRRHQRFKESQFLLKHGHRHHSYDPEKAPYPISYDRHVLELESMDFKLVQYLRRSVSFADFKNGPPRRTLDLGCGSGTWVLEAAQEWPKCHFVGFDLVNIQVPLVAVSPSIADRVTWVHGNFLTTKLPFDDDEFDHVHVNFIARGVPENKWGVLFEEINRILSPEGIVEICEDDITFPVLPRWFTAPFRAYPRRAASVHFPEGSQRPLIPSPPSTPPKNAPAHDHALLESLYLSVFESRFINLKPTAVLPDYFSTYFRQLYMGPVVQFPMPPLPPLQPLPKQIAPSNIMSSITDGLDLQPSMAFPVTESQSQPRSTRPASQSISSTLSPGNGVCEGGVMFCINSGNASTDTVDMEFPNNRAPSSQEDYTAPVNAISPPHLFLVEQSAVNIKQGPQLPNKLDRERCEQLKALDERSLAMHLYKAYQGVLACQEAMWQELKDRLRNRKEELRPFGWDNDEELEELKSRNKFERLVERYKSDMQARVAFWCSLTRMGWPLPSREPLTKAELIEEERLRQGMLEARRWASADDFQTPCRATRVLIGKKGLESFSSPF